MFSVLHTDLWLRVVCVNEYLRDELCGRCAALQGVCVSRLRSYRSTPSDLVEYYHL